MDFESLNSEDARLVAAGHGLQLSSSQVSSDYFRGTALKPLEASLPNADQDHHPQTLAGHLRTRRGDPTGTLGVRPSRDRCGRAGLGKGPGLRGCLGEKGREKGRQLPPAPPRKLRFPPPTHGKAMQAARATTAKRSQLPTEAGAPPGGLFLAPAAPAGGLPAAPIVSFSVLGQGPAQPPPFFFAC